MQVLVLLALAAIACVVEANPVFDVHRLMQVDRGTDALGSRRTAFNLLAASASTAVEDLSRRVVVIRIEECTLDLLESVLVERKAGALLLLLPRSVDGVSEETLREWQAVEHALVSQERQVPVYFAVSSPELGELEEQIRAASASTAEDFRLVVTAPGASKVSSLSLTNFQGWLGGAGGASTLAVVAYYDSFAVAAGLANGADSNGSGVVALLEIARIFRKLYEGPRTQGRYNLLFILTSGGRLNYAGAKSWLNNADARLLESLEFALCLDSIGGGGPLHLHIARPPKEQHLVALHERFQTVANVMNIPFNVVHKKINVSSAEVPWEHEQFSRARPSSRIVGATLSRYDKPDPRARSSVFDNKIDVTALKRNIRFVSEVLAAHIFDLSGNQSLIEGSLGVNDAFVDTWAPLLSSTPRVAAYEAKKPPVQEAMFRLLRNYTTEATKHTFKLEADISFYTNEGAITMSAFTVKPVVFDVVFTLVILAYLALLFVVLAGWEEANAVFKALVYGSGNLRGRRLSARKQQQQGSSSSSSSKEASKDKD